MATAGPVPFLLWLAALAALAAGLLLSSGCSKRDEPKITGSRSAAPVSLACSWKSGYAYHVRLDTEILTESETTDPHTPSLHRVTFAQECLIKVTNAPRGDNLNLYLEILSLEMERAKGEAIALSFNSEQGGETIDEHGYIPALKKLIGGHLRFILSPDGKVLNTTGLSEWLDRALGSTASNSPSPAARAARAIKLSGNVPGGNQTAPVILNEPIVADASGLPGTSPPTNATRMIAKKPSRLVPANPAAASGSSSPSFSSGPRDNVGRTLRGFFTADFFRQLLEFHFIPPAPVRVGDEWNTQGDTSLSGRGRLRYDAKCKFEGWQLSRGTNCARIDGHGKIGSKVPASIASAPAHAQKKSSIDGTVWVNTALGFPATTYLDRASLFAGDTNTRVDGTNRVTTTSAPKYIRQTLTITLLKATSLDEPVAELKATR